MAKLQSLIEKFLDNLDLSNSKLKLDLDYRLRELNSSTEEDKERFKEEICNCMKLVSRQETLFDAKISITTEAIEKLENNAKAELLKDFNSKSILNLKEERNQLMNKREVLKGIWYTLNDLRPIPKKSRSW